MISYDLDGGYHRANAMDFENEGYVGTAIIYNQEDAIPSEIHQVKNLFGILMRVVKVYIS